MKKLLLVLIPSLLTTGCASALYTAAALSRPRQASHGHHERPAEPSPVGRWDNVMMLDAGTPLKVLMMDGTVVTGRFITANNKTLRLDLANLGPLGMMDVMRVDRVGPANGIVAKNGAKGALLGAGVVGVAGLIVGVAPPPRVFAGGALIGAYKGAADAVRVPGPGTIYVAPSPASSGSAPEGREARIATQTFSASVRSISAPDTQSQTGPDTLTGEGMIQMLTP